VHDRDGRRGQAISSLVSGGCIISGSSVWRSLLFTGVMLKSYSQIENAVIMPEVEIDRSVRLNKVIIDRGVRIPAGLVVGEDPELDAKRFRRTKSGVCLITQPMIENLSR
jgi:glucose-1-phosphate adenylyltransferase